MPKVTIEVDVIEAKRYLQQEALEELNDLLDTIQQLFYETCKSSCGYDCAMTEVNKGIDKIREALEA